MSTVSIVKKFKSFHAAHQLPNHDGKCRNLHGHTYHVEGEFRRRNPEGQVVTLQGAADEGMVIDFSVVSQIYEESIFAKVDHALLLGTVPLPWFTSIPSHALEPAGVGKIARLPIPVTTCEYLALHFADIFIDRLDSLLYSEVIEVVRITVWETETSFATASP